MPYRVHHLYTTGLNSPLIGLEPSSTGVNRDSRHGWLEAVGRVTPHQAVVCTSFILIGEFNNSYLKKGTSILFVLWVLVAYSQKHLKKLLSERSKGNKHLVCADVIRVARKELGITCQPLLAGLKWEVGSCVKEPSDACQSPAVLLP